MYVAQIAIRFKEGLHARPAADFVKLANRFCSAAHLVYNGREANGKSILSVMALGVNHGEEVSLLVEGEDAEDAFKLLKEYLTGETV